MRKNILYVFLMLVSIILFGCQMGGNNGSTSSLDLEEISPIKVGETVQLTVNLISLDGTVIYESSNEDIIVVDENGVVTAISSGKATIFATIELKDLNKIYSDAIEIEVLEVHKHDICANCGKCYDEECPGEICTCNEDNFHEHIACPECGLCTSLECDGKDNEKCLGHKDVDSHVCEEFKSDWILPENITCGQTGTKVIICTKCNDVLQEQTYKLQHAW